MRAQSIQPMLENLTAEGGAEKFTGKIKKLSDLLSPATWIALEKEQPGPYLFLAFHPVMDPLICQYVKSGALAADSGEDLFVIFFMQSDALLPTEITDETLGGKMETDQGMYPAYELAQGLFTKQRLNFPGLLV